LRATQKVAPSQSKNKKTKMYQSWENLQSQQPRPQSHELNQCSWIRKIHNNSQLMSQNQDEHITWPMTFKLELNLEKKVGNV
jgi:hypothetical protein